MRKSKNVRFRIVFAVAMMGFSAMGCSKPDLGTPPPQVSKEQQIQQIQTDTTLSPAAKEAKLRFYGAQTATTGECSP